MGEYGWTRIGEDHGDFLKGAVSVGKGGNNRNFITMEAILSALENSMPWLKPGTESDVWGGRDGFTQHPADHRPSVNVC